MTMEESSYEIYHYECMFCGKITESNSGTIDKETLFELGSMSCPTICSDCRGPSKKSNEMVRYVVGFCFSKDRSMMALVRKTHPEWQKGKLNGIGGHIEKSESIYQAMKREFKEEAGVIIPSLSWNHKFTIVNESVGYELNVMYLFSDAVYRIRTITDEEIGLHIVEYILNPYVASNHLIKNLAWIIPLILDKDIQDGFIIKDKGIYIFNSLKGVNLGN